MTVSLFVATLTIRSCRGLLPMPHVCRSTHDTDGGPATIGCPPEARLRLDLRGIDRSHMTTNRGHRSVAET